jgi:hypothetical protein
MEKCPKNLLQLFEIIESQKTFEYDMEKENLVAGLTSKEIKILLHSGLRSYLDKIAPGHNVSIGMILHSIAPARIHSDFTKSQDCNDPKKIPSIAMLIPLEETNSHTIVFEQEVDTNEDIKKLPNIDSCVSIEFWQKHMSHCDEKVRSKISLQSCNNWIKGIPIIWNRKNLHCSDNHLKHSVAKKRGVVLFLHKNM